MCKNRQMVKTKKPNSHIVIESDNCSLQCKSWNHFENMQQVSNKFDVIAICVFGVAEHRKGEVDHVGGLAKTTIRRTIASGELLSTASAMVEFMKNHFEDKEHLIYKVCEILKSDLDDARFEALRKGFLTIDGSSLFQVMVFTPHSNVIKASPRLCLCDKCKVQYGSCSLFEDCVLCVQMKKVSSLRSEHLEFEGQDFETNERSEVVREYLQEGTICAIAAATKQKKKKKNF